MDFASTHYIEHPEDVLTTWLAWRALGPTALAIILETQGGGVRAAGSMMAVRASQHPAEDTHNLQGIQIAGYLSGGCIDEDIARQAAQALKSSNLVKVRYGEGSPYMDLPLPCGGSIEVLIIPDAEGEVLSTLCYGLKKRQQVYLGLDGDGALRAGTVPVPLEQKSDFTFIYSPKLKLRIAGRGADPLALARLAISSGIDTKLYLLNTDQLGFSENGGAVRATNSVNFGQLEMHVLITPDALPETRDDPWTAFVLMMHDREWETALLLQALRGPGFYIGAVGSDSAQLQRKNNLARAGLRIDQLDRVRGPIGLVASMRSASMLAVSTLAEIIDTYHHEAVNPFSQTAIILLAAGQSNRYGDGDKLMADYNGRPVLSYSAQRLQYEACAERIAIVSPDFDGRAQLLRGFGWGPVINENFKQGQASSIALGMHEAAKNPRVKNIMILLGDMPFATDAHLKALKERLAMGASAVLSNANGVLTPPAMFDDSVFNLVENLSGDVGAKTLVKNTDKVASVELSVKQAHDIDTTDDLVRAKDFVYGE